MARITYDDKNTAQTSPLADDLKYTSGDANEVKNSVNALYDINGVLVGVAGAVTDIGEGTTGQVLTSAGPGVAPTWEDSGGGSGERVWEGYLTQIGTGAPTIVELTNTLGGTPVFGYVSPGLYIATLAGAFGDLKTSYYIGSLGGLFLTNGLVIEVYPNGSESILIQSGTVSGGPADNTLFNTYFRITVKP